MEIKEQFKPFPLNQGVLVGHLGTIIRPNGRKASNSPDNIGYLKLSVILQDGSMKSFKQHRIVALTWIENPHNLPEVNHLDGIKVNNAVSNLEWSTHSDNMQHGRDLGLWTKPCGRPAGYKASEQTKQRMSAWRKGKTKHLVDGKWKWIDRPKAEPVMSHIITSTKERDRLWKAKHAKYLKQGLLPI